MKILGIKIDNINFEEAINKVGEYLVSNQAHYIVTPNPEIILAAQKDNELKEILNSADLAIPDGIGLILAAKFAIRHRVTGIDLMLQILQKYKSSKFKFIVNENGLSSKEEIIQKAQVPIDEENPQIIFVGLGCPVQEKWIRENSKKYPSARVILTVGGGFDFLTGKQKRAPLFFRQIGLEWLWRLFKQPRRYKRILNATIKFLWRVIWS